MPEASLSRAPARGNRNDVSVPTDPLRDAISLAAAIGADAARALAAAGHALRPVAPGGMGDIRHISARAFAPMVLAPRGAALPAADLCAAPERDGRIPLFGDDA